MGNNFISCNTTYSCTCAAPFTLVVTTSLISCTCTTPGEYPDYASLFCMPWQTCSAGQYELAGGTPSTNRVCESCASGTYSDTQNAPTCKAWKVCSVGEYVSQTGSSIADRVCDACVPGKYSTVENADKCTAWTVCLPGQFVATTGTVTTDHTCNVCVNATYSSGNNSAECTPWTACDSVASPPSASTDRVCSSTASSSSTMALVGATVGGCTLVLAVVALLVVRHRRAKKTRPVLFPDGSSDRSLARITPNPAFALSAASMPRYASADANDRVYAQPVLQCNHGQRNESWTGNASAAPNLYSDAPVTVDYEQPFVHGQPAAMGASGDYAQLQPDHQVYGRELMLPCTEREDRLSRASSLPLACWCIVLGKLGGLLRSLSLSADLFRDQARQQRDTQRHQAPSYASTTGSRVMYPYVALASSMGLKSSLALPIFSLTC